MSKIQNNNSSVKQKSVIFLIGFMGCGKTTLGKKTATVMDQPFLDLDELVTQRIGMSIPEYFSKYGEHAFREQERKALHELAHLDNGIVATGGGAPCYNDNMEWMNTKGITVYLKMSAEALFSRLSQKERQTRPLLKEKNDEQLLTFIKTKLLEREPYYSLAQITLDAIKIKPKSLLKELAQ